MDFDDTRDEREFRLLVRGYLESTFQRRAAGTGGGRIYHEGDEGAWIADAKATQLKLYEDGWAGITWPKKYGGRGGSSIQSSIWNQEVADFDVNVGSFAMGIGMAGPTIMAHGTDEQKERYLAPMLSGQEFWVQLFSEPGAGSDLANISTKAVRDGDEFVVTGQKVWTSSAQFGDFGILLARTNPDQPKHRGITYFLLDMSSPGIDIRPLVQITGATHFSEVFLDEVRVPASAVLGEVDGGWGVAMTTLAYERGLIGGGGAGSFKWPELERLARETNSQNDPLLRQALARAYTNFEIMKFLRYRIQTALSKGERPGTESSVMKLFIAQHLRDVTNLALGMDGADAMLDGADARERGLWVRQWLQAVSVRIAGGSDEVQRNVLGERVLGLPPEPRVDKDVPFNQPNKTRS
ncbi:MAG: acyl-CoA dehydrogenase family protein [Acidimicrobiia bacterium]|jgi:acyl-CoA dehydrogenase|nr:acyl-CoA dehydrogenase family protein [Acidimicrobiia bacterium]MBP8182260.1 acyl-CoA dehydrogenase family protein [Acidimicrobiia bacterium]